MKKFGLLLRFFLCLISCAQSWAFDAIQTQELYNYLTKIVIRYHDLNRGTDCIANHNRVGKEDESDPEWTLPIMILVNQGADPNILAPETLQENERAAIHLMAEEVEMIDFLYENGANINLKNINGNTILDITAYHGTLEEVYKLIYMGAVGYEWRNYETLFGKDDKWKVLASWFSESAELPNEPLLHRAVRLKDHKQLESLLEEESCVDQLDIHKNTAIFIALVTRNVHATISLLKYKADILKANAFLLASRIQEWREPLDSDITIQPTIFSQIIQLGLMPRCLTILLVCDGILPRDVINNIILLLLKPTN